jgi:hypothetical protein
VVLVFGVIAVNRVHVDLRALVERARRFRRN